MQRKLKLILTIVGGSLLLSACGYNPNTSTPTPIQQCNSLQRQILFNDENVNGNPSHFQNQSRRQQLRRSYNELNCFTKLKQARHPRPAPAPTSSSKKPKKHPSLGNS